MFRLLPGIDLKMAILAAVLFSFFLAVWIYDDAKERGSDKPKLWAISVFVIGVVFDVIGMVVMTGIWLHTRKKKEMSPSKIKNTGEFVNLSPSSHDGDENKSEKKNKKH